MKTYSVEEFKALDSRVKRCKRAGSGILGNLSLSRNLPASAQTLSLQGEAKHLRILGIDTSLRSTGLAVIETFGAAPPKVLDYRPVKNPASRALPECLVHLRRSLLDYIEEFSPDAVAMEGIFYCRNPKTSLILGHARGVIVEVCAEKALPMSEYAPRRVKQAVTGKGSADKAAMQRMMQRIFSLPELPQEDAADALAIAYTHFHKPKFE